MKSRKATTYKPNKKGIIRINYNLFPEITGEIYVSEENTKLGPIPSFNTLPANYTYRFNDIAILGTCSQACRGCYGMKGQYNMSGPVNVEARNTLLISENMAEVFAQLESWAKDNSPEYFRIHSNGDFLNIDEFNNWIELVIEYDACGTDAFDGMDITDKQREAVACAHRDMRHVEDRDGNKDADDFCESAKDATYGWMTDFNMEV